MIINQPLPPSPRAVNDALDSIFDDEEADGEADTIMSQVLDEIGIEVSDKLHAAPVARGGVTTAAGKAAETDDLMSRLAALKVPN